MSNRKKRIIKGDYTRVLLTETLPFEVPIIFSNDGFYNHGKNYERDIRYLEGHFHTFFEKDKKHALPMKYKYKTGEISYRELGVMHPKNQWKFRNFYKTYGSLICYYCTRSEASLRHPLKVGSTVYTHKLTSDINKYKNQEVDTVEIDKSVRHNASYFAYGRHRRLHKFFNSSEFLKLERKYPYMWSMDVSKCFSSIYTHTITWAVKDKQSKKAHLHHNSTFGDRFDRIIRQGNDNETNGIIVGPEFSRIFAEIIFQEIDMRAISVLREKEDLIWGKDYEFRRYVDDMFLFARKEVDLERISSRISEVLLEFNFHVNEGKFEKTCRPFITQKTQLIESLQTDLNHFLEGLIISFETDAKWITIPSSQIRSITNYSNAFIRAVKTRCATYGQDYGLAAGYLISTLANKIDDLCSTNIGDAKKAAVIQKVGEAELICPARYLDCIRSMLNVMFFLYNVSPSVNSSFQVSKSIIISLRFARSQMPALSETISQAVYELCVQSIQQIDRQYIRDEVHQVPLEVLNILIAMSELVPTYLVDEKFLIEVYRISDGSEDELGFDYFSVMTLLFYTRGYPQFELIRKNIFARIRNLKICEGSFRSKSVIAHTVLDLIACPHVPLLYKARLVKSVLPNETSLSEVKAILKTSTCDKWFINWKSVNLLSLLEKKRLNFSY